MKRDYQIEATEMTDEQLKAACGGVAASVGFGARTEERLALQQKLTAAYASNHPFEFNGIFG